MSEPQTFNWKIGGAGGYGLQSASNAFGRIMLRGGFFVHVYDEFPSVIKGGPSTGQVVVSERPLRSHRKAIDFLVCLNQQSIVDHQAELVAGGWLVYDADVVERPPTLRPDITVFPFPLTRLTHEVKAEKLTRNVVALGATFGLLNYPLQPVQAMLQEEFGAKGESVVEMNRRAVAAGAVYARQHAPKPFPYSLQPGRSARRLLINGNDALSLGAIAAGCRFYAAYPMTPASSILSFMVKYGPEHGLVVRQLPDEIAVVNVAIGAAYAGVRSLVASSGGGFSLMVESLGLAAMTETPLVIIDAQRPGPATGLPTWTEQGDLRFVMHAAPGDFPRVVLAPGDPAECFALMPLAFNLAEQYQLPVIVLTDKYLAESWYTTQEFDLKSVNIARGKIVSSGQVSGPSQMFARYADGISGTGPRVLPGTPGLPFMANSDEHDVYGLSNEESDVRRQQHQRRLQKLVRVTRELPPPIVYGSAKADLTVLAWGSSKGPVLDAIDLLAAEGRHVNFLYTAALHPFPASAYQAGLKKSRRLVLVEGNATGQFGGLVTEQTGVAVTDRILRFDGRPFEATELAEALRERLEQ